MTYPHPPTDAERERPVLAWRDGGIAHLRFNRPHALNAIDAAMAAAFCADAQAIAGDAAVRVVVVAGQGRAFQAGGDIAAMALDPVAVASELIAGMHGGLRALASLNAPVIASVHGAIAGGGLGVLLCCDLAIAAEGTKFSIAYPAIGASADCGTTWGLPRLVGLRQAMQLALLAEPFRRRAGVAPEPRQRCCAGRRAGAAHARMGAPHRGRRTAGAGPLETLAAPIGRAPF